MRNREWRILNVVSLHCDSERTTGYAGTRMMQARTTHQAVTARPQVEVATAILFLYHLQNLVGKASHSLDGWVTVLLVYVMKGDDRNLIGLADLFY